MFNIVNFGAIPDGKTINTAQIQTAIDACHAACGGQVVVLEDVHIRGDLAGIPDRTVFTGCENMIVRNCTFE